MPADRARWTSLALAAPWAAWAALRATGTERGFPLVPALAFTPYAAVTSALPLAAAALSRSRAATALAAGSTAVLAAAVLDRTRPHAPAAPSGADGPRLRVLSLNMLHGRADPVSVVALADRTDADVLALMEVTPRAVHGLLAAGVTDRLLSGHVVPAGKGQPPGAGGALWTRLEVLHRSVVPGRFGQPTVRLAVPGALDVELTAAHTHPPARSRAQVRRWEEELSLLPAPVDEVLRVIAGDLNATPDHASFRRLLAGGWVDAALATGEGLRSTWSPLRTGRPRLTIDHVLVDPRMAVRSFEVVHVAGTDHRAIIADLQLPTV